MLDLLPPVISNKYNCLYKNNQNVEIYEDSTQGDENVGRLCNH